jgi:hypothetical protein
MTMKRTLLILAVMAVALLVANPGAQAGNGAKMVKPDWHYCWHEGRWWYWLPEGKWMVWTGSAWTAYRGSSGNSDLAETRQAQPSTSYASYETEGRSGAAQPASPSQSYCPPTYSGYSSGAGSNYAGYGWTWGPGTANRDTGGRPF